MSIPIQLNEPPPRSDTTVSNLIRPMMRNYRSVVFGLWILCGASGMAFFVGGIIYHYSSSSGTGSVGWAVTGLLAAIAAAVHGITFVNMGHVRQLLRDGTVFMGIPNSDNLEELRVQFHVDGMEFVARFDFGVDRVRNWGQTVPLLFEPSNSEFAILLLPNGTGSVGRVSGATVPLERKCPA